MVVDTALVMAADMEVDSTWVMAVVWTVDIE
jgi:hypothetical protein